MFNVARTGTSGTQVTTGVRGLDAEQIANAQPNPAELAKQEKFMHGFLAKHPDLTRGWSHGFVMFGVGAAFDFHAGLVRQAPRWIQRGGLEWLFRTAIEPRRLWKRYAVNNPAFLARIIPQMMDLKRYPLEK
jgi:N-acetylglucosaminyldiphosphoundecaprenol N-acetyl-beta-D-mannosaminyltransferase